MTDPRAEAWKTLSDLPKPTLEDLFAADPRRVEKLSGRIELGGESGGVLFDWSKTHLDDALLDRFEALAGATDFAGMRARLFAGEVVNPTEGSAVCSAARRR